MNIIIATIIGMLSRLLTASFVEFTILKLATMLVERTDSKRDDEFLKEIKKALGQEDL